MIDTSKYVGIPYEFAGSSFEGADCIGLLKLIFATEGWTPDFDDGKPMLPDWYIKEPKRIERYLIKHFDRTKDVTSLTAFDIVYFMIEAEGHVGLLLPYGKCLSTFPPGNLQWNGSSMPSKSFVMHRNMWEYGFLSGFKRR